MRVAYEIAQNNPQMMGTASVAARVLSPAEIDMSSVHTIQAMMDAGWNPNQIQRPDIWTSQAILMNNGGYPTPSDVRKLRLDPRYIPRPGSRVPPELPRGDQSQNQSQSRNV